ncbi:hypothetical protein [Streptomyces sp. CT1-17]|nr:hypothetical protein [Streptomyces sp. CT1-17]
MEDLSERKLRKHWSWAERWQVALAAAGLLVAIISTVGQYVQ